LIAFNPQAVARFAKIYGTIDLWNGIDKQIDCIIGVGWVFFFGLFLIPVDEVSVNRESAALSHD